jgi:hypothetical protein
LESHERLYRIFKATPPFWFMSMFYLFWPEPFCLLALYLNIIMNTWHKFIFSIVLLLLCGRCCSYKTHVFQMFFIWTFED